MESKESRVIVKKTKIIINTIINTGKITKEGKFTCAVCEMAVMSNSNPSQFCRCLVHKRGSDITDKLKEDSNFSMNVRHARISK